MRTDSDYCAFYNQTSVHVEEQENQSKFTVTVVFPETAGIDTYKFELYTLDSLSEEVDNLIRIVFHADDVNDEQDVRGEIAAELIENAHGVYDATYSSTMKEVKVRHKSYRTDTYDTIKYVTGLTEQYWWVSFDYTLGEIVLSVEYDVERFVTPLPDDKTWDDLRTHIREKQQEKEDDEFYNITDNYQMFEYPFILHDEYHNHHGEIVVNEDVSEYPRLAGTESTVVHAYYLVAARDGDIEEVVDTVYAGELQPEEVEYMVEWAKEHYEEEAIEYSLDNYNKYSSTSVETIDEMEPWEPVSTTNETAKELFSLDGSKYNDSGANDSTDVE